MQLNPKPVYLKVPILGNRNVGKTSLFYLFRVQTAKHFSYKTNDFILLEKKYDASYTFHIQFWDNFGANSFKKINKDIFQNASVAIAMYDVSDISKKSYEDISKWVDQLWKNNNELKVPIILIGNKIDLRKSKIPTLSLADCTDLKDELSNKCNIFAEKLFSC